MDAELPVVIFYIRRTKLYKRLLSHLTDRALAKAHRDRTLKAVSIFGKGVNKNETV